MSVDATGTRIKLIQKIFMNLHFFITESASVTTPIYVTNVMISNLGLKWLVPIVIRNGAYLRDTPTKEHGPGSYRD